MASEKREKFTSANPGRTYRVTQAGQQVGPWVHPAAFSEYGFAAAHPIPDTAAARAQIDPDTYHADLLWRLEQLGHVVPDPDAVPIPAPDGPHGAALVANQAIRDSVAQHAQTQAVRAAAGQEDQKARATDNKAVLAPSVPPVSNAAVTAGPGKPADAKK